MIVAHDLFIQLRHELMLIDIFFDFGIADVVAKALQSPNRRGIIAET
jgi:hypothetical protein